MSPTPPVHPIPLSGPINPSQQKTALGPSDPRGQSTAPGASTSSRRAQSTAPPPPETPTGQPGAEDGEPTAAATTADQTVPALSTRAQSTAATANPNKEKDETVAGTTSKPNKKQDKTAAGPFDCRLKITLLIPDHRSTHWHREHLHRPKEAQGKAEQVDEQRLLAHNGELLTDIVFGLTDSLKVPPVYSNAQHPEKASLVSTRELRIC